MKKEILVTGGVGFIGSHCVVELLQVDEYEIIVVDNLFNSNLKTLENVEKITNKKVKKFYQIDLRDMTELSKVFEENNIEAIIHFAALKAVGESVQKPLLYYQNNLVGTLNLLELAQLHHITKFIFSSSATVYGIPKHLPLTELSPTEAISPYGSTKLMVEKIIHDLCRSNPSFHAILLRYFNPVGAHPSGLIGEDPKGEPNNLFPVLSRVLLGMKDELTVFGNDYDTPDGTCIRDYIHIQDLASGHLAAIQSLFAPLNNNDDDDHHINGDVGDEMRRSNCEIFNLGTGSGISVLEAVKAMEKVSGKKINIKYAPRREGDAPVCYANADRARHLLSWSPRYTLPDMCQHLWNFHLLHSQTSSSSL